MMDGSQTFTGGKILLFKSTYKQELEHAQDWQSTGVQGRNAPRTNLCATWFPKKVERWPKGTTTSPSDPHSSACRAQSLRHLSVFPRCLTITIIITLVRFVIWVAPYLLVCARSHNRWIVFYYKLCVIKSYDCLSSCFLSLYSPHPEWEADSPSNRSLIKKMGGKTYPNAQVHGRVGLQWEGILVPTGTGTFGKTLRERDSLDVSYNEWQGKERTIFKWGWD